MERATKCALHVTFEPTAIKQLPTAKFFLLLLALNLKFSMLHSFHSFVSLPIYTFIISISYFLFYRSFSHRMRSLFCYCFTSITYCYHLLFAFVTVVFVCFVFFPSLHRRHTSCDKTNRIT